MIAMLCLKNVVSATFIAFFVSLGLGVSSGLHADEEGFRIMTDVDNRYRGDSWSMDVYLLLTDENGRERERTLRMLGKMYGDDERTLTYVRAPSRLRGTGILTYDWAEPGRNNESWLYLPDLGRVTRLTTANRADYFLGTDFTYGDLEGLEVEDFYYEVDSELSNDNEVVVVATPKSREIVDKYGYTKIQYWVDTEKDVYTKAQYWLENEGWIKYYSQFDFEQIDGVWLSGREQMVMTRNNRRVHSTILTRGEVAINPDIPDNTFTTNGLERAAE
ncbi:outer membrane lipoprotein-sorting protein [Billgrantia montanilacus]|uniref:Outer membrane lipoprotein-sorting protein n=1 Tax=Billgrantia montanilacus TaxID=2282305 RepID=A0A368U0A8_9GAMM|nr:outer membrane lipoprotein-sorting protein [Halomonas montanilacus]RCV90549.1 outer membrane lipoprotein-sorting protein [Halomonas montanilacus]